MGSGKKKQPSYQGTEATIAPAITVAEPVPDAAASPVATKTALAVGPELMDPGIAVASEPQEVTLAESLVQDGDVAPAEPAAESIPLATSLAPDELVTPITEGF